MFLLKNAASVSRRTAKRLERNSLSPEMFNETDFHEVQKPDLVDAPEGFILPFDDRASAAPRVPREPTV
jgi:hypothetical protein